MAEHLVPSDNQPYVALHQLSAAATHGAEGRVNLNNVRIGPTDREPSEARLGAMARGPFFCYSRLTGIRLDKTGDGQEIHHPLTLHLKGRQLPTDGVYDLEDVGFISNGRTTLVIDEHTRFVPHPARHTATPAHATTVI